MNPIAAVLAALSFLSVCITPASGKEIRIDLKVDGKSAAKVLLKIEGDIATAKVGDEIEQFNLKNASWFDATTRKWTTLTQCKEWANQSKAKSLKSADAEPANVRSFLLWFLEPT